jgi:hypothetical protein
MMWSYKGGKWMTRYVRVLLLIAYVLTLPFMMAAEAVRHTIVEVMPVVGDTIRWMIWKLKEDE